MGDKKSIENKPGKNLNRPFIERMKIAFLIYSLEKAGGSERVTVNLANELQSAGHNVSIIALHGNHSFFDISKKVLFYSLHNCKNRIIKSTALIKLFNNHSFDYLITISIGKLGLYLGFLSFFIRKEIKVISSEHLSFENSTLVIKFFKLLLYKRFYKVVVLTKADLRLFEKKGLENVVSISNASSYYPNEDTLKPILDRSKVILAVGRLEHQKGFDMLIKSWALIYHLFPSWNLCIVGEGSLKQNLIELINANFTNPNSCKLLPFTHDMNQYYGDSQVFALSSRFEGLPMVMIEALCFGCSLISFDCETGPREIIVDNYNGNLVVPGDIVELAEKLRHIIIDNEQREHYFFNQMRCRKKYLISEVISEWNRILI